MMKMRFQRIPVLVLGVIIEISPHTMIAVASQSTFLRFQDSTVNFDSKSDSAQGIQLSASLLWGVVLLVAVVVCLLVCFCRRLKHRSMPESVDEFMIRRTMSFHQDLLNDDEMQHLWSCWQCDFANYAHKTHCALCGCERWEEKTETAKRGGDTNTVLSQAATNLSSSRNSTNSHVFLSPNTGQKLSSDNVAVFSSPTSSFCAMLSPPSTADCAPSSQLRRKEWRKVLNKHCQLVWSRHVDHQTSGMSLSLDELVLATAFVSRVGEQAGSSGRLTIVPAEQALVYPLHSDVFSASISDLQIDSEDEVVSSLSSGPDNMETIPCDADDTSVESFGTGCMRSRPFPEKHRWFMQRTFDILSDRRGNPTAGKLDSKLVTPRGEDLLAAAVSSLVSASETELRRPLRVQFENEPSLDTGGVAREWFGLVAAEFLDERRELFQVVRTTGNNSFSPTDLEAGGSLAYAINPKASLAVHDYLSYYRAFGRFIGKALLEGHLVQLPMTSVIFKHILGEPVSFVDLIELDGGLARSLQLLWDTTTLGSLATVPDRSANVGDDEGQDEEDAYGLDFSVYHTAMGTVDLKPNGRNICVTKQNKREYVTLFTQWHLARSTAEELEAIVLGVHDVVPEELLAPFDFAELRLLLCGLPVLDLDDWKSNTVVAGKLRKSKASRLTRWFWSVLQSMSNEQRERLLQFATGSCRVPVHGFKALTSSDGRLCSFTLQWLPLSQCLCPRAHTCLNRLDLPTYSSQQELKDALHLIVQTEVTGFSIQ